MWTLVHSIIIKHAQYLCMRYKTEPGHAGSEYHAYKVPSDSEIEIAVCTFLPGNFKQKARPAHF